MTRNKNLILVAFLGLQIIFIAILKNYPEFVEQFYSNGLFVFISKAMRYTFGWLTFSVGDILYTLTGIYIIRWLIINRKRIVKDTKNWLLDVAAALSIAYFAFHILWAYNYYRLPLHKSLAIDSNYTTEELISFTERLIKKSNDIHSELSVTNDSLKIELPYTKSEIYTKVKNGYTELSKTHSHINYKPQSIKTSLYSKMLTNMGFSGYLNPFTIEAQVNGKIPIYKLPTTASHEAAHQLGYAAENEANFIGAMAAIKNSDIYFNYSGYTFILRYCLSEIRRRDSETFKTILQTIRPGILKNYKEVEDFWSANRSSIEPVFEKTFDTFLKANNQSAGMKSYSYIVALMVNYYKDKPL